MKFKSLFISTLMLSSIIYATPVDTGHAEVSLIKTYSSSDSNTVHLGIKMDMQEGWHTYWINPGDSGGAIDASWTLPDGMSIGEVDYPSPHKIPYPPLMTFGYEDYVIFPIVLNTDNKNNDSSITAKIDFLICADVCIPESAIINTSLNLVQENSELDEWMAKVPSIYLPNKISVKDNLLEIRFSFNEPINDIYFFPMQENIFVYLDSQQLIKEQNNWLLKVPLMKDAPNQVDGVLVINEDSYLIEGEFSSNSTSNSISIWQAIIFAFIGGLILNIMPCVFPIISLKALSFVSMGGGSTRKIRLHALNFCFGVILSFLSVATLIILLQKGGTMVGWGFQLQSPLIVSFLSILMFIIGLILLMDINIGTSLTRLGGVGNNESTYTSSFLTGVLAVVVASPCTAPFMGAAIGYALIQPSGVTLPIFLALGIGFSLPYLLLALFPQLISKMPRPGEWMNTLKEFFAFPMFATALWLLWVFSLQTNQDSLITLLATILFVSVMFWLSTKLTTKSAKLATFVAILIAIGLQLNAVKSMNQNTTDNLNVKSLSSESWSINIESELQNLNQAYLINFTAAWCITCQANDKLALSRPGVVSYLQKNNIRYIKADWTNRDNDILKALTAYGRTGVPLYLYWKPGLNETKILPAVLTEELLLNSL
ncbi:protein-disulfide reductase DsbD family protein [Gammaproteobacteria bacterium]|nr:protein-disulfide reductase DsbD family protein [Gammaproteobacteria bacterium]